jgi:hypothetical protein
MVNFRVNHEVSEMNGVNSEMKQSVPTAELRIAYPDFFEVVMTGTFYQNVMY